MLRHEQTIPLQPQQEEPKWECEQLDQWPVCPQQDTQVLTMPLPEQKAPLQLQPGEPKWGCARCEGACAVSPAAPSVASSLVFAPVREMDREGNTKITRKSFLFRFRAHWLQCKKTAHTSFLWRYQEKKPFKEMLECVFEDRDRRVSDKFKSYQKGYQYH